MLAVPLIISNPEEDINLSSLTPKAFKDFLVNILGIRSTDIKIKENLIELSMEIRFGGKKITLKQDKKTVLIFSGYSNNEKVLRNAKRFFSEKWIYPKTEEGELIFQINKNSLFV